MSMCLEFMPMSAAKIIERQNNPELICLIPSVCCAYWSKNTESESYYTKRKNSAGSLLISTREENLLPERQQINTYLKFTNKCAAAYKSKQTPRIDSPLKSVPERQLEKWTPRAAPSCVYVSTVDYCREPAERMRRVFAQERLTQTITSQTANRSMYISVIDWLTVNRVARGDYIIWKADRRLLSKQSINIYKHKLTPAHMK